MELSELCSLVASKARCEALKKILAAKRNRIVAIDGLAGVSSIIGWPGKDGENPAEGQKLEFISSTTLAGGIVWLRYAVTKA